MQPAPQNKRRLSLVSNGRYEGSLSEEVVIGEPAGEGPQPRVYTISGEPALLPGPEAEAIELAVVKGRRPREQHPRHHSQSLRGSRENVRTACQSWAGGRQGSQDCPECAQPAPGPSPRAFGLDQPPRPQATGRRKKLERMYSVDRVSGEGPGVGVGAGAGELGRSAGARSASRTAVRLGQVEGAQVTARSQPQLGLARGPWPRVAVALPAPSQAECFAEGGPWRT